MTDPIRERRRLVARWVGRAKRVGYTLLLLAIVLVVVGLATELSSALTTGATLCLIGATALLAPAIILGYAVNAAERDDRARGR